MLPALTFADLRKHEEFWRVERDLEGHGITAEQIKALEAAGVGVEEVIPTRARQRAGSG